MKQFNIKEYLENPSRKVVTGDGRTVRIICTDAKGDFPIVALMETPDGSIEFPHKFKNNGHFLNGDEDYHLNLFFTQEKHEGWVNVYRIGGLGCRCIFDSEEEARQNADEGAIATVKIEWEE